MKRTGMETVDEFIVAIIKPFKLEEVRDALSALGVKGITVTEVQGYGRQKGHTEVFRGAEYNVAFVPKLKVEVAVPAELEDAVIETITSEATTGRNRRRKDIRHIARTSCSHSHR